MELGSQPLTSVYFTPSFQENHSITIVETASFTRSRIVGNQLS